MRPLLTLAISIFLIACSESRTRSFSRDDFDIYSTIINTLYPKDCGIPDRQINSSVLVDSTSDRLLSRPYLGFVQPDGSSRKYYGFEQLILSLQISSSDSIEMIDDLLFANSGRFLLPVDSLKTILRIIPLKTTQKDGQKLDDFYEELDRRYSDACGFLAVSRIGYNALRNLAIVNYELHCGSLCGNGAYAVFRRLNGKWIKIGSQRTFES